MDRLIARVEQALERQRRIVEMRRAAGQDATPETVLLESLERAHASLTSAKTLLTQVEPIVPGGLLRTNE